ncbi:MAG: hypothetical protein HQL25_02930 [Candidatus Omnitrophica bacterium]|nr:hypothetical protein [Candidatus Omnitrophota bacterium]
MDKNRLSYAGRKAFTLGIYYGFVFSLVDIFYYHYQGKILLVEIVACNFCLFLLLSFVWGYFEYPSFAKKEEKWKSRVAPKEFRCFKCEALITPNESKCIKCGWSWDKVN